MASPPWDGYLKETVNFFETNNTSNNANGNANANANANTNSQDFNSNINSISTSFSDFGDGFYKGVLNIGTSITILTTFSFRNPMEVPIFKTLL